MIPTFAGGDNLVRILAPHERAVPVPVVGLQVCVHGIHQRLQGGEVAALQASPRASLAKRPSTACIQELEVGVK